MTNSTRKSWVIKPRHNSRADMSNPLCKGLKLAYLFNEKSGQVAHDLGPTKNNLTGTSGIEWTAGGLQRNTTSITMNTDTITVNGQVTIATRMKQIGTSGVFAAVFGAGFSELTANRENFPTSLTLKYDSNFITVSSLPSIWDGDEHDIFAVFDVAGDTCSVWIDGQEFPGGNWSAAPTATINTTFRMGQNGFNPTSIHDYAYVWDRILTPSEIRSMTINPYQIFPDTKFNLIIPQAAAAVEPQIVIPLAQRSYRHSGRYYV